MSTRPADDGVGPDGPPGTDDRPSRTEGGQAGTDGGPGRTHGGPAQTDDRASRTEADADAEIADPEIAARAPAAPGTEPNDTVPADDNVHADGGAPLRTGDQLRNGVQVQADDRVPFLNNGRARAHADRWTVLGLLVGCALIYFGTAKGILEEVDDVAMLRVTESIVRSASFAVAPDTPGASEGRDGRFYPRYGLGLSLLGIPFYVVGAALPSDVTTHDVYDPHGFVLATPLALVMTTVGNLSAAGAVALVYLTNRRLRFSPLVSLAAAVAIGLGTFAWFYSRTFMTEAPSMLFTLLTLYGAVRFFLDRGAIRWLVVSGAAAGMLLLLRIGNAVLIPPVGVWVLWTAIQYSSVGKGAQGSSAGKGAQGSSAGKGAQGSSAGKGVQSSSVGTTSARAGMGNPSASLAVQNPTRPHHLGARTRWQLSGRDLITLIRQLAVPLAAWGVPILVSLAIVGTYNLVRFGSLSETGYGEAAQSFTTPIYVGLYGLLLSPGKSVFLYAPILLAATVGWPALRRVYPGLAWTIAAMVTLYVLFYARYDWWYGGGPWAPRFLTVILPLAGLPLAALLAGSAHHLARPPTGLPAGGTRPPRLALDLAPVAVAALAVISVAVQLLGILVPYLPYDATMEQDPIKFDLMLWHPTYSPLVAATRDLAHHTYPPDVAFSYFAIPGLAFVQLAASATGVVLLALVSVYAARYAHRANAPLRGPM